ncbi:hypothetical protein Syun_006097 [Stephania yunnanensis]|uniref:RRM domain-containing protein n=1 Tax=Stephania yunnanensis TaxID=152371 RepID=A0AAP0KW11_9MAGN
MSSSSHISVEDFYAFHTIDRELFTRLVIDLRRDPGYSMLSLALFLWFNNIGFLDVVVKLRSLPDAVVDVVGEEATIILRYLETGTLPPSAQLNALENLIPTIRGLMDSRLTFQFLQEQRIRVLNGVSQLMEDVCSRAFVDIVQRLAVIREREAASTSVGNQPFVMPTNFGVRPPIVPPMAPAVPPRYVVIQDPMVPQMGVAPMNESLAAQQEHTMFMTFSRGYPVSEAEARDYFTRNYGDCIDSFHMEEVEATQQALYARVVYRTPAMVTAILAGRESVRFVINGKHVRVRRWVSQNRT